MYEAFYNNTRSSNPDLHAAQIRLTPKQLAAAYADGRVELDVAGFVEDFIIMQAEDWIVGRLSSAMQESIMEAGWNSPLSVQQLLNFLRRTEIQGEVRARQEKT